MENSNPLDISGLPEDELDTLLAEAEESFKILKQKYVPHEKQEKFHRSNAQTRCVFGGNRSGKTEMGTLEARFHSTGDYPDWYPEENRFKGATRGRIVVTDYSKGAKEVLEPKISQWFPEERIIKTERFMGHITKLFIRHRTGGVSTIDVMTHEQEDRSFEGWSGHWVWFDEPPPRNKYVACQRGLIDFNGKCWLTLTPISEPWLWDEIVGRKDNRMWHITVDIDDNPYLSKEGKEAFILTLREDEREARLHGKPIHLIGRVYKELDTEVHLIDKLPEGNWAWPKYFVLDPADRRAHHGIWATVDPMGTVYIFEEIVKKATIKDFSKMVREVETRLGIDSEEVIRVLDPNKGRTPSAVSGLRLVEEFGINGLYFNTNVNDDIATGHLAVKEYLTYDKTQPISVTNCPKLFFVKDNTIECIRQLLSYVWDDWKNNGSRAEKEVPKDINKDMPDCVRYLIMYRPVWIQESSVDTRFSEVTGYID